jgi:hypothetical protein
MLPSSSCTSLSGHKRSGARECSGKNIHEDQHGGFRTALVRSGVCEGLSFDGPVTLEVSYRDEMLG